MSAVAEPVAATAFTSIVRLERVQKFFGPVQALRDIDIAIGRNEIVGLIGDNGAGKSTLIKVMTGVMPPTAGRMFIRDQEVNLHDYSVRTAHDRLPRPRHHRRLDHRQPLRRRAPGHRHRPGDALPRRPHHP